MRQAPKACCRFASLAYAPPSLRFLRFLNSFSDSHDRFRVRELINSIAPAKGIGAHNFEKGSIGDVPCDVALPSATQNELDGKDARTLVTKGVMAVGEGANMPCTPEAVQMRAVLRHPPSNATGRVTGSWSFEPTEERLADVMRSA